MTDKQIIIDGVDVSGCEDYEENPKYRMFGTCDCMRTMVDQSGYDELAGAECKGYNCYYKQLKRKEQECKNNKTAHQMELDIYNKECLNLLEELKAKEQECEELKGYLNQIRDEELSHLDIEWNEYETSARKYDYSNIITLVERALGEIDD